MALTLHRLKRVKSCAPCHVMERCGRWFAKDLVQPCRRKRGRLGSPWAQRGPETGSMALRMLAGGPARRIPGMQQTQHSGQHISDLHMTCCALAHTMHAALSWAACATVA